jgi:hypothetical protein
VGSPVGDLQPGDEGRVLTATATAAHVKWADGSYSMVHVEDVSPVSGVMSVEATLDDSLDVIGFERIAARDVFEDDGPEGLLNQMSASGHLASFAEIAEDTLDHITGLIRQDHGFMSVVASLDEREQAEMLRLASIVLIRDAFLAGD